MSPFIEGVFATLIAIAILASLVSIAATIYNLRVAKIGRRERALGIRILVVGIIALFVFGAGLLLIPEPYSAIVLICFLAFFLLGSRYRINALKRIREEDTTRTAACCTLDSSLAST